MTRLQPWAEDVWTAEMPKPLLGADLKRRMVLVRLPDGRLWAWSPVDLDPGLEAEVRALGEVRHLVAPNKLHHLAVPAWKAAWPEATVHGAPGLRERVNAIAALPGVVELGNEAPADWGEAFAQRAVTGSPLLNEVVFLHRPSGTLLVTDLAFHANHLGHNPGSWLLAAFGVSNRLTSVFAWLGMRDRGELRAQLGDVLAWDFDRAILSHGDNLEAGARHALLDTFAWLEPTAGAPAAAR